MDMDNSQENIETISQPEPSEETDSEELYAENRTESGFLNDAKTFVRFCRKKFSAFLRDKMEKKFTNVVYLTTDCPLYVPDSKSIHSPAEFIEAIRVQYPTDDIRILVPLLGIPLDVKAPKKMNLESEGQVLELERTSVHSEIFIKNNSWDVFLYKFKKDESNIQVYGIYSQAFSFLQTSEEIMNFEYLPAFLRASRAIIKALSKTSFCPDIVHSDRIPFYMGSEFEYKLFNNVKVFQTIDDFIKPIFASKEPFWAAINLADKASMSKICKDIYIQKYVSRLFNLPAKNFAPKMRECLDLIYKNYNSFMDYSKQEGDGKGDFVFKHLNERILKLFPNFVKKEEENYYPILSSIKRSDYWAVISKTYYKNLFESSIVPEIITRLLIKTMDKSGYVSLGLQKDSYSTEEGKNVYKHFNSDNFRELRQKNKMTLLKEFSQDNVKTNFVDPTLFKTENVKIYGHLDSFYEAPLLFANPSANLFEEGVDILFSTILKLLELNKNIQVIICVKDGFKNNFIKTWINFLSENKAFSGRWVFVDGQVNYPKFFAGADMFLLPERTNNVSVKHLLGMFYGCVPIASKTGFLNDSIIDIFDNVTTGNGFKTRQSLLAENDKSDIYYNILLKALEIYKHNHSSWNVIVKNCINTNFGWDFKKLEKYEKIYQEIL